MTNQILYRQFELTRVSNLKSIMRRVLWLPERKGPDVLVEGTQLTLDGEPENLWTVVKRSEETRTRKSLWEMEERRRSFGASLK